MRRSEATDVALARRRGHQVFFGSDPGAWRTNATSSWAFSTFARQCMERPDAVILMIGAGIMPTVPRVIQMDLVDYPNVDVITTAEELPFIDEGFDAVVCENVIEHVRDPFILASEIDRVLKPGGRLGLNGTNMHFTHGFPSHYWNPTEFGMRDLLEARHGFAGSYDFQDIPSSLRTVLDFYLGALHPDDRRDLERVTLGNLVTAVTTTSMPDLRNKLQRVPERVRRALSTNIYFSGQKPSDFGGE